MSSRTVGVVTRSVRRQQQVNIVAHEQDQDDDDVVESTASAFDRAKRYKSRGSRQGTLVVDLDSGSTNKAVVAPVEEPKLNCPICLCPFTEEMTTKCGHIFCNRCIKDAISHQAKCPTCRKEVNAEDLIRVFLPTAE